MTIALGVIAVGICGEIFNTTMVKGVKSFSCSVVSIVYDL